jgi:hypothetical protein
LLYNHVARDFQEVVNSPNFVDVYKPLRQTGRMPVRLLDTLTSLLKVSVRICVHVRLPGNDKRCASVAGRLTGAHLPRSQSDHLRVEEEAHVLHAVLEHMRIVEEMQELRVAATTAAATPAIVAAAAAALEDEFHQLLSAVRIRFVPLPQLLQLSRCNVHLQRSMLWRQNVEHLLKLAFNEVTCPPYLQALLSYTDAILASHRWLKADTCRRRTERRRLPTQRWPKAKYAQLEKPRRIQRQGQGATSDAGDRRERCDGLADGVDERSVNS